MANGKPPFMNNFEYGTFILTDDTKNDYEIPLKKAYPNGLKGVLIYSNAFDIDNPKANKPVLGAYSAVYIAGSPAPAYDSTYNVYFLNGKSTYAVNWGQGTDNSSPAWRSSRTESRGIYFYRPSTNVVDIRGFGTGEYDFKRNVEYHYIVWD